MAGTIIITGANGSLAIPAVAYLLSNYPDYTAILTVRNASEDDANTTALRAVISRHPQAKADILELDLSVLSAVHDFTKSISKKIDNGTYPKLASIVCNAFWWSLTSDAPVLSADGYEKSVQVNHISHAALVLRLLTHFEPAGGRIVTLSSEAHVPGKATFEQIPPRIPDDLDSLVKPPVEASYPPGRPFQRYGNSKLAVVMWTHALNRRLVQVSPPQAVSCACFFRSHTRFQHPNLGMINAIAMDPGSLVDSRALTTNTSPNFWYLQKLVLQPFRPLLRLVNPAIRNAAEASPTLIDLAIQQAHPGERGHFELGEKMESSPDSLNVEKQDLLWEKTLEWAGLTSEEVRDLVQ